MLAIVEQTESRLRLLARPPRLVMAAAFLTTAAWLFLACPTLVIECRKIGSALDCHIIHSLFGVVISSRRVESVTLATTEFHFVQRGKSDYSGLPNRWIRNKVARVILHCPSGVIPVEESFSSPASRHEQLAASINQLITAPNAEPKLFVFPAGWEWVGFGILLVALMALAFSKGEMLLDREQGTLTVRRLRIPQGRPLSYSLDDIDRFVADRASSRGGTCLWKIRIRFLSGVEITAPDFGGGPAKRRALAQALGKFMTRTLPFRCASEAGRASLIHSGKICAVCGRTFEQEERVIDQQGRSCHRACYERAVSALRQS